MNKRSHVLFDLDSVGVLNCSSKKASELYFIGRLIEKPFAKFLSFVILKISDQISEEGVTRREGISGQDY